MERPQKRPQKHPQIAQPDDTLLLIIDMQGKLFSIMKHKEKMTDNVLTLIQAAKTLEMPIVVTEQYRKGLGPTYEPISEAIDPFEPLEKMTFSCAADEAILDKLKHIGRKRIIIVGIETHVCIQQTALDLIALGHTVYVPLDATSSRFKQCWKTSIDLMRSAGTIITTTESLVFELLHESGTPQFKALLPYFK
jgi:nicotinamidase-related amidase